MLWRNTNASTKLFYAFPEAAWFGSHSTSGMPAT
jgi:hypothetical protein